MTIVIDLGLYGGSIGGIFITEIFGNFYTKRGGIFDFQSGNSRWPCNHGVVCLRSPDLESTANFRALCAG